MPDDAAPTDGFPTDGFDEPGDEVAGSTSWSNRDDVLHDFVDEFGEDFSDPNPSSAGEDTPLAWRLGTWMAELLSVPRGLIDSYVPGSNGLNARTREQLILSITEVNDCRYSAWIHGAWLDFLGPRDLDEALVPLFDYARACAEAGVPLDTTGLDAVYPRPLVRSLRATVAHAELANLVGNTIDDLGGQLGVGISSRAPSPVTASIAASSRWSPVEWIQNAATVTLAMPFVAPAFVTAVTMKAIARLAPSLPEIAVPPPSEANLVVHLLAEAAPTYLGHAVVRTSLVWSPLPLSIAFRMEGTAATIRVGRGHVAIENGVQPDAMLVVDGGIEPLLQTVAGSILRDLGAPIRRLR